LDGDLAFYLERGRIMALKNFFRMLTALFVFYMVYASHSLAVTKYSIIDLGTPGETVSQAFGINDKGEAVGYTRTVTSEVSIQMAFVYTDGQLKYLNEMATGLDINNIGQIAGSAYKSVPKDTPAALWEDGNITRLGTDSSPIGLNDLGQAVGEFIGMSGESPNNGYLWDNGNLIEIKAETGLATAFDINNNTQIVGRMVIEPGLTHGFIWENNKIVQDLGTLGGNGARAISINDLGHVIGDSNLVHDGPHHAVLWKDSDTIDLGTLDGYWSEATAINNNDQIVGNTHKDQIGYHVGFIWENGVMYDLNDLILPFENNIQIAYAADINNKGQIVGSGYKNGNTQKAILLTPTYEVTKTQNYLTDYLTLGDTFAFDYWWEMGIEPTDFNLDVLFFNEEHWETFGWNLNFDGSSSQWETASFYVPEWARGENTRIMFSLLDLGQETDPTVYLRNIGSAATSVPDAPIAILLGTGLLGLFGLGKKKFKG
jgi:probable HAF family extracellular repeat protein